MTDTETIDSVEAVFDSSIIEEKDTREIFHLIKDVEDAAVKSTLLNCANAFLNKYPTVKANELWANGDDRDLFKALRDARCFYLATKLRLRRDSHWAIGTSNGRTYETGDYEGQVGCLAKWIEETKIKIDTEALSTEEKKAACDELKTLNSTFKYKKRFIDQWIDDFIKILNDCQQNAHPKTTDISIVSSSASGLTDVDQGSNADLSSTNNDTSLHALTVALPYSPIGNAGNFSNLSISPIPVNDNFASSTIDMGVSNDLDLEASFSSSSSSSSSSSQDNENRLRVWLCLSKNQDASSSTHKKLISTNSSPAKRNSVLSNNDLHAVQLMGGFIYVVYKNPKIYQDYTFKVK